VPGCPTWVGVVWFQVEGMQGLEENRSVVTLAVMVMVSGPMMGAMSDML